MPWSREEEFYPDDDTIKTPTSPDSVCCPPSRLTPMIGQPGTSTRVFTCDQSAAVSSTNGSDSTWRSSSLLGSDGIPWWEDNEASQICHGAGSTPTVYLASTTGTGRAAPTAESIHADLVVFLESMRGDKVHIQTQPRHAQPIGGTSVSDDESSVTSRDGEAIPQTSQRAKACRRGEIALTKANRSSLRAAEAANAAKCDDSSPMVDCSRGRANRQESVTRRRRSLSNSRAISSGSSNGSGKIERNSERKSSWNGRLETDGTRRRSFSGARAMVSECDFSSKNKERSQLNVPEEDVVGRQRESASYRRRSHSGSRLGPSSKSRPRSSRALIDASSECEHSLCGEEERQNQDKRRRRPSLSMTSRRRRSLSGDRVLSTQSRSRSSRTLYESDDIEGEPSLCGDDDASHRRRRSSREDERDSMRRQRSRSSHNRLLSGSIPEGGSECKPTTVTRGRSRGESDEMPSSSRHQHRRSKSGRDLMASSHIKDDGRTSRCDHTRRSPSRHGERRRHHRSRSQHMRSSSPEDHADPESKTAVKKYIKGLLKDAPSTHNRPAEESSVCPSRRQATSNKQDRRPSCGGLDTRSRRTSSRRPSGKHM